MAGWPDAYPITDTDLYPKLHSAAVAYPSVAKLFERASANLFGLVVKLALWAITDLSQRLRRKARATLRMPRE